MAKTKRAETLQFVMELMRSDISDFIWGCDTHLNIFILFLSLSLSLYFSQYPSHSLPHGSIIMAMDSEIIINPVAEPTCTHMLTSLITYLRNTVNTNKAHTQCTYTARGCMMAS